MTEILSDEAVAFVTDLTRRFRPRRNELLAARAQRRAAIAAGASLDFLPETADIRAGDWTVPAAPADLTDRRVE
ncbi:malate synthase A, partial [Actinoplanes sp. NPDC051633]